MNMYVFKITRLITVFVLTILLVPIKAQIKTETEIADSLVHVYQAKNGPGIAVKVIRNGKTIYTKEVGLANLEDNTLITAETPFHIASVSKQFTAFAALLLESRGLLSMDDDIKKYLPELKDLLFTVRLSQLANHTHGFPNTFELAQLIGVNPDEVMTHAKMVNILLNQRQLNFEPGSQYQYNNAGFTLLAEIVERVSGMPFAKFVKKEIFDPLHMENSIVFDDNSLIIPNKAYAYRKTKSGYAKTPYNFTVVGGSGINTTSTDLALWALNFEEAKIGSTAIFEKMKKPSLLNDGTEIPYGLGLETKSYRGLDLIFHGGGDAGYRSYLMRIPKQHFTVVILGNLESFNPLDLAFGLTDLYLHEHMSPAANTVKPKYSTADLQKWAGNYEIFPGSFFTLLAKDDGLFIQPFGQQENYALPVEGDGIFTYPYAAHSKFVFDKKGLHWHFSDFSYLCTKVNIHLPKTVVREDFIGAFWNERLHTAYTLTVKDGQLIASHALNSAITLHPLAKDTFYATAGFFGKVEFKRNKQGKIVSFLLSGQNINQFPFIKVK